MIILGIDPGLAIVGWGVIEYQNAKFRTIAYGSINTPAGTRTEERLRLIFEGMNELIEKYKPNAMAVEELFFTNNITTGIRVAEARGVILLAAENACVPIFEYTPPQVKQAVVGYGKAEKSRLRQWLHCSWDFPNRPSPTIPPMHLPLPFVTLIAVHHVWHSILTNKRRKG